MKALRRLRALRLLLLFLGAAVATPRLADAQVDPDRVSVDLIRQSEWFGELWPADFNRDGRTDITALLNQIGSPLIVSLGRGDGTFDPAQVVASGTGTPIGVGDVDGDGFIDIVTSSHIVPGRGDGTFQAPVLYATPSAEIAPAQVLDISGDGRADLVLTSRTSVHVYPGNGDFTFGARLTLPSGFETESMIVTDLNADGLPDIATTSKDVDRRVNLFFNGGALSFSTSQIPLPFDGGGITARDLNGDGLVDLIVGMGSWGFITNIWTSGQVAVFLGLGDGAFSPPLTFPTLPGPIRVVAGDFNGDGLPDVATGNETVTMRCETVGFQWASVSVLLGRGDGTLGPAASFALGRSEMFPDSLYKRMRRLNTSDLNGDGRTDLLASAVWGPSGAGALLLLTPPAENRPPMVDAGPDIVGPFDSLSGNYLNDASVIDPDHDWQTFEWRDAYGRVFGDTLRSCLAADYGGTQEFTLTADDGRGGVHSDTRLWTFTTGGPSPIPDGFTGENIGTVSAEGTDSYQAGNDVFTVVGSGADIWGTADAFRFVHTSVSGNFDVTARVIRVDNIDPWTKVGLMIRQSRAPGSRHAFVFATPTAVNGVAFQRRLVNDGLTVHTWGPAVVRPVWLRLTREGDLITAYSRVLATDPWTLIGTETLAGLTDPVHVGMAVTSHKDGTAATGLFQAFVVTPLSGGLPAGWHTTDVGAVGATGSATAGSDGRFTVTGSGADIWKTVDAFHYTYTRLAGNGAITVRVASLDGPHEWSKAGLMIRESLDPAAAHHFLLASQGNGLAYQRRLSTGAVTDHTGLAGSGPVWFRIQRRGTVVRLFYSLETSAPASWQLIAKTTIAPGEIFVGLAVTSHADGQLATATFDSVALSEHGWQSVDVGTVGDIGTTTMPAPDTIVMTASGTDIWGTEDAFRFTYQELTGDGTVVARVATLEAPHAWSKAGVMIRQSTDAGSPHAFMFVSRDNGLAFQRRVTANATTVHTSAGSGMAPQWLRLTRSGDSVTAAYSADGADWTTVGTETLPIDGGPVLIGVALTSHDNAAIATASFEGVVITP